MSATEQPDNSCWKEIRLGYCEDGEFKHRHDCKMWVCQLAAYIKAKLGNSPRIRIHAYRSGGTLLAVDVFSAQNSGYIPITIIISKNNMCLSRPVGEQLDIALPGIVDALELVCEIVRLTQYDTEQKKKLWISRTDGEGA